MTIREARARCWAEIDLDALCRNYDGAKARLGNAQIMPVVKGDAYGLGAVAVARALYDRGAHLFAVATMPEALALASGAHVETLVLGLSGDGTEIERGVASGVRLTVYSPAQAARVSEAAVRAGRDAVVHIKLDTGLHRLGIPADDDAARAIYDISRLPRMRLEGLYTHLALRDQADDERQHAAFLRVERALCQMGLEIPIYHMIDSIGMLRHPAWKMDMARIGAWLYGVAPRDLADRTQCLPVVTLRARVAQIRDVSAGERIGYDEEHPLARDTRVATLSAGYADGYPRANGAGWVIVRGEKAPVLGLVCMDQMMVDVTDIPDAEEGDAATLLGDGITVDEYAAWTGINRNDALSRIGRRVPRVYVQYGHISEIRYL